MSSFSVGQLNQLGDAFEADGWNKETVTKLGQCGRLADIRAFLEGRAEIVMKAKEAVAPLLTLAKTVVVPAIVGKKTSDCFTNKSRYYHQGSDLGKWFPPDQPRQPESKFSVFKLSRPATFKQVVESFLRVEGDIQTLSRLLKERGHITTFPTVEFLIERQEAGEDVGLLIGGLANFLFLENKDRSVSVVDLKRDGGLCRVDTYCHLAFETIWDIGDRFFFRNQTL